MLRPGNNCCGNEAGLVQKFIGSAYDVVKNVHDNLEEIKFIFDFMAKYDVLLCVESLEELKQVNWKSSKFVRMYMQGNGSKTYVDYIYVADDNSGVIPDHSQATGSWVKVDTLLGAGGGNSIPWLYNRGSANGGEVNIHVEEDAIGVSEIFINGLRKHLGIGYTYEPVSRTIQLSAPLAKGDQLVAKLIGYPALPNTPNISEFMFVNWVYNNGAAIGGETKLKPPYTFQRVPAVFINGLRKLENHDYVAGYSDYSINLTLPLKTNDVVIVQLGGEADAFSIDMRIAREALRRTYALDGLTLVSGSFEQGGTLSKSTDVLLYEKEGNAYVWGGAFPKAVPVGSTPQSTGGIGVGVWVRKTDPEFRNEVYSNFTRTFTNVANMVADGSLKEGQSVRTLGYYSASDLGGGEYLIKSTGTADGFIDHTLSNGLIAVLKVGTEINIAQAGAKMNNVDDDQPAAQAALNKLGVRGSLKFFNRAYFKSPLVMHKQSRGMRLYSDGKCQIKCDHNGHGLVIELENENYGRNVIENLEFTGPNLSYPSAGYVPPSTGMGIRLINAWDNTFINCGAFNFDIGLYLDTGYNNKFIGGCEVQFNQHGVYIVSTKVSGTNINIFEGVKIRENRARGVTIDGSLNSLGARPTGNRFINCYIESNTPWFGGYAPGGPGNGTASVGVWIKNAYSTVFEDCYSENHEFSYWIDTQSSRNIFKSTRHDYSSDRTRHERIRINGDYCLNNTFIDIEHSAVSSDAFSDVVEVILATSVGTQFIRPVGINFDKSRLAAQVFVDGARPFSTEGGTKYGQIQMPPSGYVSNPSEGTTQGKISGIGTTNATLYCYGLGEISLQGNITANTTITNFDGLQKGQIFVLWNYQQSAQITVKSSDKIGVLYLRNGADAVLSQYGDHIVFYVNGLGRAVEIGRNIAGAN